MRFHDWSVLFLVLCTDHGEEVPALLQLASDSDGEVYCDSMEQFGLEEVRGQPGALCSREKHFTGRAEWISLHPSANVLRPLALIGLGGEGVYCF